MPRKPCVLAFLIAGTIGCTTLPHPTPNDVTWASARWPETTLEELERGRAVYVGKCAGCHHLHRPEEYSADRWRTLVAEMRDKAKVKVEEEQLIVKYLGATSTRLRSPPIKSTIKESSGR